MYFYFPRRPVKSQDAVRKSLSGRHEDYFIPLNLAETLSRDYLIWQWPKKLIRFSFHQEAQQCHGKNKFKLERTSKLRPRSTTQLLQTFYMACQCKKTNKTKSPRVWKGIDKYKRCSLSNLKGSFDSESVICIPIAQSSGSNRQKVELLETLLCQTPIWQVKRRKKNRDVRN